MTLYLLKVHLQTFLSIPITHKCQILSCDTLVANERYVCVCVCVYMYFFFFAGRYGAVEQAEVQSAADQGAISKI